jgi:putative transposase
LVYSTYSERKAFQLDCPHCSSANFVKRNKFTKQGYQIYFCRNCNRQYNERTFSPFNKLQATTKIIFEVLFLRLRYKLSLRDLCEIFYTRSISFTHQTIADWEAKFLPLITEDLQKERLKEVTERWKVDELMIKVDKEFYYLYRSIDSDGKLVDVKLSKERSIETTTAFLEQAVATTGVKAKEITSDKNNTYPKAIKKVLGKKTKHRTAKYLNNKMEQNHRGVRQRTDVMLNFKSLDSAKRFCQAFEELKEHLRTRKTHNHNRTTVLRRLDFGYLVNWLKEKFLKKKLVWKQGVLNLGIN